MKKVIIAKDVFTDKLAYKGASLEAAALWLRETGRADCRGRIAAQRTVITNIKHCIAQPKLYTQFYGLKWYLQNEGEEDIGS